MATVGSMTSSEFEPGSAGWIKAQVAAITGQEAEQLSLPGGAGRKSVRVHLAGGGTVIATVRDTAARGETEAGLLQVLSDAGAPVPRVYGFRDGLMVQEDVGPNRVSVAMTRADPEGRIALARAALAALQACRAVMAARPKVVIRLPGLGTRRGWAEEYVSHPFFLSGDLNVAVPQIDADALAISLSQKPVVFTRTQARLANAAVRADGTVVWHGWDGCGRRGGVEDLGGMIADEAWGVSPARTLGLLEEVVPEAVGRGLAVRMAVLVAAHRLGRIAARLDAHGWSDPEEPLRLDRMAAVPDVVSGLTSRMAAIALADPLTAGFGRWFEDVGAALLSRGKR